MREAQYHLKKKKKKKVLYLVISEVSRSDTHGLININNLFSSYFYQPEVVPKQFSLL